MKRTLSLLMAVMMLLCTLTACSPEMFMSSEQLIAKGDEALANNDLDEALSYYNQAGPEGDEKEKQVLTRKVLYYIGKASVISGSNGYVNNLKDAMEYLEDEAKYTFTEEERYEFLLNCCNLKVENMLADGRGLSEIGNLLSAVSSKIPPQTPGYEDFLNNNYFTIGYNALADSVAEASQYGSVIRDATWYWEECTAGPGYECVQAINFLIPQGDFQEGFAVLTEHLDEKLAFAIANELREYISFETVSQMFAYEAAYYSVFPRTAPTGTLTEAFAQMEEAQMGNDHRNESVLIDAADLESSCGLAPDGRILFLHKPNSYEDTLGLYLPMMDLLPNAYYPNNLESVEYVVLMSCETVETGATFGSSTKEVREDTTVTAIDVKTGDVIFETLHEGPTHYMMTYYGEKPPTVYSAGAPNVRSGVQKAVSAIESYMAS